MIRPDKRFLGLIGLVLVVGLLWWAKSGGPSSDGPRSADAPTSQGPTSPAPELPTLDDFTVPFADLPIEAQQVIGQIETGGPFTYAKDGTTFGNRERLLPLRERGYYREYTVPTPGSSDRGPRRIIAGGSGELYYTDDHYETFRLIGPKP